ncbi:hypothetical protein BP422_19510 [Brevibacillus formosus]|uniref:Uncharacterized protein n=1 Tax=Brevibacillus formosus TaxID=54913 RepID=A0A220ML56_9BACL|nr:hypothetical protein [Brevibacillus formosus]ASJ55539.1 hypothetical protein BP422_19510 [Brevibacillus formosus]
MNYHILKDVGERGQVMCTDPEWQMNATGPNWGLSLDDGPGWAMKTTGPEWEVAKLDDGPGWEMKATGPDWELKVSDPDWGPSLDGGPGWQMYGPPDGWGNILQYGPIETGTVVLH